MMLMGGDVLLNAKIAVFLKPDNKSALFREVKVNELMLPQAVNEPALASEGWHTAKIAVSVVGFTMKKNVMKEMTLAPGSDVYVRPTPESTRIAKITGQEMVKVIKPGPWTQVTLAKPVTVFFQAPSKAKPGEEIVPLEAIEPIEAVVEVVEPKKKPPAPEETSTAQSPNVTAQPKPEPNKKPKVEIGPTPQPSKAPDIPKVSVKTTATAATAPDPPPPPAAISDFDLLESIDPKEIQQSVAPVSSALLEEIQELDPLEVREGENQPLTVPQLPVEIKPTVTISRNFEGTLIYKKPFFRRPGLSRPKKQALPYQLIGQNGKRIAYVRVEDLKVGNILKYVNKKVILAGPLEENAKGKDPVIQGRTIRLDL